MSELKGHAAPVRGLRASNSNRQYVPEQVVTVAPGERTNVKVIYE